MSEAKPRVGVLGLGALGMPIALRLLDGGFSVAAHDLSEQRLAAFRDAAGVAGTVGAQAVLDATVLCVVTPDADALWDLISGTSGGLDTGRVETILLHSTVLPQAARELAVRMGENGVTVIDAPVSGGPDLARDGQLTLLLGSDGDLGPAGPVLSALGQQAFRLGPVGAASAVKLANQLVLFASVAGLHEGLRLTEAFGVGEAAALEALATATGDTWAGRSWGFFDTLAASYDDAGTPPGRRPWRKDLEEFVVAAEGAAVGSALAAHLAASVGDQIELHARSRVVTEGEQA